MSSNKLRYDTCAYRADITQSTNTLRHILDPMRFEHHKQCRMELGIVGGNEVSQIKGNLVDLENDLRGQTRLNTKCPQRKYQWQVDTGIGGEKPVQPKGISYNGIFCRNQLHIDTQLNHLPPCQMIRYEPIPLPPPLDLPSCAPPAHQMQTSA